MTYRQSCRAVSFLILLLLVALPVFAGKGVWTPVGPPGAGTFSELVLDPSNPSTLYAVSFGHDRSGIWKSVDSAESWVSINAGLSNSFLGSLIVDPLESDRLWVLGSDRATGEQIVFRSLDGGLTWTEVHRRSSADVELFEQIVADPFAAGNLYARAGSKIWRSVDLGMVWNLVGQIGEGSRVRLMADPTNHGTLYASAGSALWRSASAGSSWGALNSFSGYEEFDLLALGEATPAIVYGVVRNPGQLGLCVRVENDGKTTIPIEFVAPDEGCVDVAVDPDDGRKIYALSDQSGNAGLYYSTTGGDSWVVIHGVPSPVIPRPLRVDFENDVLYLIGRQGIHKSTDGGQTWEEANQGITAVDLTALLSTPARQGAPAALYAVSTDGNLVRTRDGGQTWKHLELGPVSALAAEPGRPSHLIAVTIEEPRAPRLFESFDQGETWASLGSLPLFDRVTRLAVNPTNPRVLYAGATSSGILKSTNGGRRWRRVNRGLPPPPPCTSCQSPVRALEVHPRDARIVHAVYGWQIYRSLNGGKSWTPSRGAMENAGEVYALILDPARPNVLYAGTRTGVFKSTDGGATWRDSSTGLPDNGDFGVLDLAIDARGGEKILYVATRTDGVFRSTDQGATWEPLNEGLPILEVDHVEIDYRHAAGVFAGTSGAGVWGWFE